MFVTTEAASLGMDRFFFRSSPRKSSAPFSRKDPLQAPLLVEEEKDGLILLDGHLRLLAAKGKGILSVPVRKISPADDEERFSLLWSLNGEGKGAYTVYERGLLFSAFWNRGLSVSALSRLSGLSFHESEDLIEVGRFPRRAGRWTAAAAWPAWAVLMLLRHEARWAEKKTPRSAARLVWQMSKMPPASTVKDFRFLLDFYWSGNRPAKFHK